MFGRKNIDLLGIVEGVRDGAAQRAANAEDSIASLSQQISREQAVVADQETKTQAAAEALAILEAAGF